MKKRIEKYFPAAMKAIEDVLQGGDVSKVIDREYQGYISAFGAAILQMGLMPTLAVHADEGSGAIRDKRMLLDVLARTMNQGGFLSEKAQKALKDKTDQLFKVAVEGNDELRKELTEHLLDVAIAVKLCLRTFKLTES